MKLPLCLTTFVFVFSLMTTTVYAETYTDNMRDMDNNRIKSYQNLQPLNSSSIPQFTKEQVGPLALTFFSPGFPLGAAFYQIQGAQTVSVEIYTWLGTFGSLAPGQTEPMVGMTQQDMSYVQSQSLYPLLLGDNGMVYGYVDGRLHKLTHTTDGFYRLRPTQERGSFVNYGVNVYYSTDGVTSHSVPMTRERGRTRVYTDRVFERFTGNVPAGAKVVWVEINDFTAMDVQRAGGVVERMPATYSMRTILNQVSFSGSNLILGAPEIVYKPESSSSEPQLPPSSSSQQSSSRRSSSAAARSVSSYNSSKFEGEVTSAPRSQSSRASAAGPSRRASSSAVTSREQSSRSPEPTPEHPRFEPLDIIRLVPSSANRGTVTGVSVYIVVMIGLVAFLLLRKRNK